MNIVNLYRCTGTWIFMFESQKWDSGIKSKRVTASSLLGPLSVLTFFIVLPLFYCFEVICHVWRDSCLIYVHVLKKYFLYSYLILIHFPNPSGVWNHRVTPPTNWANLCARSAQENHLSHAHGCLGDHLLDRPLHYKLPAHPRSYPHRASVRARAAHPVDRDCALNVRHAAGVLLGVGRSAAGFMLAVNPLGQRGERCRRATGAHSDRRLSRLASAVCWLPAKRRHQIGLLRSDKDNLLCGWTVRRADHSACRLWPFAPVDCRTRVKRYTRCSTRCRHQRESDIRTAVARTPSKETIEFNVGYRRAERHTDDPGALECAAAGVRVPLSGAALTAS